MEQEHNAWDIRTYSQYPVWIDGMLIVASRGQTHILRAESRGRTSSALVTDGRGSYEKRYSATIPIIHLRRTERETRPNIQLRDLQTDR